VQETGRSPGEELFSGQDALSAARGDVPRVPEKKLKLVMADK
jgi:hypothetical protein